MRFFDKLRWWFRGSATPTNSDAWFEQLVWLEPQDNPFGVRVLDCRPVAESYLSASENPNAIHFLLSEESRSGQQFRGQRLENANHVACKLMYPLAEPLPEGPLFLASVMEEKWNIYHFNGRLYFVRSWTGQLHHGARLSEATSELRVAEVEAWPGRVQGADPLAVRQVDYLMKSHVFNQVVPHPAPPIQSKKILALWSFSEYGRRGLFAAPEAVPTPSVPGG